MPVKPKTRRQVVLPGRKTPLAFADPVLAGAHPLSRGRIGIDPETGVAPASRDEELRWLFQGFTAVLAEERMTMDDLVWVQVFSSGYFPGGGFQFRLGQALLTGSSGEPSSVPARGGATDDSK